jgi:hypothetical protein
MLCFALSGCSGIKTKSAINENTPISVFTGKPVGTSLSTLLNNQQNTGMNMPVNALLWRATLDIASTLPLADVDTFGGSIVTDWYTSSANPKEQLKLSFFVNGPELRSDAIRVEAHVQKQKGTVWVDDGRSDELARKLEGLVLARARELRATTLKETVQ